MRIASTLLAFLLKGRQPASTFLSFSAKSGSRVLTLTAMLSLGIWADTAAAAGGAALDEFTVLHTFPAGQFGVDRGGGPSMPLSLVEQKDGSFLGNSYAGGRSGYGTVFRMKRNGSVKTVFSAAVSTTGSIAPTYPPLPVDGDTSVGTMGGFEDVCGSIYAVRSDRTIKVLHRFSYVAPESCYPGDLTEGDDGAFYGVASSGDIYGEDAGSVFKLSRDGKFSVLYVIKSTDGSFPSGLTKGSDGNFYGTTMGFGRYNTRGTVFRVTPAGVYTTLAQLGGSVGGYAGSNLVQASDGNLYGSTIGDGWMAGYSTIYRMKPDGQTEPFFNPRTVGETFMSVALQATDGFLYATSESAIYRISLSGEASMLHKLDPATEGMNPGLTQSSDGYFYGSASSGGPEGGGTLFKFQSGAAAR